MLQVPFKFCKNYVSEICINVANDDVLSTLRRLEPVGSVACVDGGGGRVTFVSGEEERREGAGRASTMPCF